MLRENRLYQTDWLLRFYGFDVREILNKDYPNLDADIDPKLSWALRNMHLFPVDINKVDKHFLMRIPGVGMQSVNRILNARRYRKLNWEHLKKMGVALNRATYFITCNARHWQQKDLDPMAIKGLILQNSQGKFRKNHSSQLSLFN